MVKTCCYFLKCQSYFCCVFTTKPEGSFTRTITVSLTIKVYHCANGNRPFDGQNWFCTHSAQFCSHSAHQLARHHWHNVKTFMETGTLGVNRPLVHGCIPLHKNASHLYSRFSTILSGNELVITVMSVDSLLCKI